MLQDNQERVAQRTMKDYCDERGSASIAGIFFTLILTVLAAAIVDVYRIQDTRTFAYSAANDAALRGASFGRDWDRYMSAGTLFLDPNVATNSAQNALENVMFARGITNFRYQIGVIPNPGGGTFNLPAPCVSRASLWDTTTWTETRPAVGVCVQVPVPTILFGLVNGNQPIPVNAFAAAGVVEQ
ncbi:hypothetical protein ANRL3_01031 [Anaerolineae bacterium]|nr:hypothetical protein ANRL3_01031 [Anaerolineae bacterium]